MITRRRVMVTVAALLAAPQAVFAQLCRATPRAALGPFYKSAAPQQTELCAGGSAEKLEVSGRVLGMPDCKPLSGALVEVWQADARGDYSQVGAKTDDARCLLRASLNTGGDGRYSFNTVLPGEYPGRPRHIHYRVSHDGYATLVTQAYFGRERGIPEQLAVVAKRDGKGLLQANFNLTLTGITGG